MSIEPKDEIKILVVEDEGIVAQDIRNILENLGYTVPAIAASGATAVERAAEIRPDLVLMDIVLKGKMDGIDAAEKIRVHFDIPVIFLTAHADERTLQRAKMQEPFGYILKPFDKQGLSIAIEMALYKHRMDRRVRESEERYRKHSRNLALLNQVSQALTSTLELPRVYERLLRAALEITDADGSSVWIWDEGKPGSLLCQAMLLNDQYTSPSDLRLRSGSGIAGWVAQSGNSTFVNNAQDDARFFPGIDHKMGFHTTSLLAVPLKTRDQVQGVLEVVNKRNRDFDDNDCFLVETLAASAAIAIENARLVEALREYAVDLETSNRDLDAFAHTTAHDLKNPLARIVGFAELLEQDHAALSAEDLRRYLHRIAQNGRRMDNIINELLLLASVRQIETIECSALDMTSIVANAQERLADLIEKHQAEIVLPESWLVALGYGPWIEEVWVNYLSNAIQYGGRPARVELGSKCVAPDLSMAEGRGSAPTAVRFWVRDNGGGLTLEEQARLFKPFTRLDQVRVKGHGLGLSIVERIVAKLDGEVGVESKIGVGSVFSFTLPAAVE